MNDGLSALARARLRRVVADIDVDDRPEVCGVTLLFVELLFEVAQDVVGSVQLVEKSFRNFSFSFTSTSDEYIVNNRSRRTGGRRAFREAHV